MIYKMNDPTARHSWSSQVKFGAMQQISHERCWGVEPSMCNLLVNLRHLLRAVLAEGLVGAAAMTFNRGPVQ